MVVFDLCIYIYRPIVRSFCGDHEYIMEKRRVTVLSVWGKHARSDSVIAVHAATAADTAAAAAVNAAKEIGPVCGGDHLLFVSFQSANHPFDALQLVGSRTNAADAACAVAAAGVADGRGTASSQRPAAETTVQMTSVVDVDGDRSKDDTLVATSFSAGNLRAGGGGGCTRRRDLSGLGRPTVTE